MNLRLIIAVVLVTTCMAVPRFAHQTPDSNHYIELAQYFQGEWPREKLTTPFVYRMLPSLLASIGPTPSIETNFAANNILFTIGAYLVFFMYLRKLPLSPEQTQLGLLFLLFSFPTLNYASGILTDPAGFFFITLSCYLLLCKRWIGYTLVACLGVVARDATLVVSMAFFMYMGIQALQTRQWLRYSLHALLGIFPVLVYIAVRGYYHDLPQYIWVFSSERFWGNLRVDTLATFLLTSIPLLGIIAVGISFGENKIPPVRTWLKSHEKTLMLCLGTSFTTLIAYSIATACISGRFIWPAYLVLIPVAAYLGTSIPILGHVLTKLCRLFFKPAEAREATFSEQS